jgi:MFS family permease
MIGATFVIGYATYFLDLIGVKDYFDASIVLYVVMLLASIAAFPLTEIIGRRTMIVKPQFVLCVMLLLIGILGCVPDQGKASWAIIVFIYVWAIIYQLSIGAVGFVLASEIATVRLRSTTQGLVTITNAAWGLVMQFTIPYMVLVPLSATPHFVRKHIANTLFPDQSRRRQSRRQGRVHLPRNGANRSHWRVVPVSRDQGMW